MSDERGSGEKITGAVWLRGILWLLMSFLFLYVCGTACLAAAHFVQNGVNEKSLQDVGGFLLKLRQNPEYLLASYAEWQRVFILAFRFGQLNAASFIPPLAPLLFLILTVGAFVKSPYSFRLWYRLNNHFANETDIEKMGLFNDGYGVFGRFSGRILHLGRALSVFGWGSPGLGKTSTVAIPSILESDGVSIVAADCKGSLVKYTSGYRAQLGRVYYFNWNMLDKPESGEIWPRWNPFSDGNLPPKGLERDHYLLWIARYIAGGKDESYWGKLAGIALEGLLQFYVSKTEQASANDYFLGKLLDNGKLSAEDKDILLSYYALMPEEYSAPAIDNLQNNRLTIDNYLPVGSWENIPPAWQGKEFCFAMMVDCLIERYYTIRQEEAGRAYGRWKTMLGSFIREAAFFGYHPRANQVMQHLYYLTKKQRKMIFAVMLEPLMVFRKNSVRERTSSSDLILSDMRKEPGIKTVYTVADNRPAAFMTRFFTDMLIKTSLVAAQEEEVSPLLFVFDDFEILPKFGQLHEGLIYGPSAGLSFMLLTDNLKNIHDNYGRDGLEDIITNTSYKLMFAENNRSLSEHFNRLAVYGAKSVQIPATGTGAFLKVREGLSDAGYYHRIANDLLSRNRENVVRKGQHLLLAQGYYHLPVRIDSWYFLRDEGLKGKALSGTAYFLDAGTAAQRNAQDAEAPSLLTVLRDAGIQVEREEEVDAYLADQIDVVAEGVMKSPQDKQSALAEDISERWSKEGRFDEEKIPETADEWWMKEDSFSVSKDVEQNPFEKS